MWMVMFMLPPTLRELHALLRSGTPISSSSLISLLLIWLVRWRHDKAAVNAGHQRAAEARP